MSTIRQHPHKVSLIGLIGLFTIWLALPASGAAAAWSAACADGFALWANSATRSDALIISGSNNQIAGAPRSNNDLLLSGSNNRIAGAPSYATSFADGGDANSYQTPAQAAATTPPLSYSIADYRPGGSIAQAAIQAGRYTRVSGDLDVSEPTTLRGIYYVTGNAKLAASDISGVFTIVAEGAIEVSGSTIQASPYADGLLLFANKNEPGGAVLKLAGGDSALRGVIYAPRGMVELSGSNSSYLGAILGDTIKLAGSSLEIAFAAGYCPGGAGVPPVDSTGPFTVGEVVLKLFDAADLAAVATAYALDPTPLDQFGARPIYRMGILDGTSPQFKAEQLRPADGAGGDERVEYAEPNYLAQDPEGRRGRGSWVVGETQIGYAQQWAPAMIGLPAAHGRSRGAGVTVAVLDTGVAPSHPALAGRLVAGFDFVAFDGAPWEEGATGAVGYGHGTHVAGLVALAAPEAQIMPVRVLDTGGVGNIWVLSEGLIFAALLGPDGLPASGDEAQVVNLSLGTLRQTRLLEDLLGEVTCAEDDDDDDDDGGAHCRGSSGAVVIAAAGNGGDSTPQYPAAEPVAGALAIGASTADDALAEFSTYGPWVRLAAPGEGIVSSVPGGGYGSWSGTSMAAPLAAGVAALVRSAEPQLAAEDVVERLVATGRPILGPVPKRLDAAAALGLADTPTGAPQEMVSVYLPSLGSR